MTHIMNTCLGEKKINKKIPFHYLSLSEWNGPFVGNAKIFSEQACLYVLDSL